MMHQQSYRTIPIPNYGKEKLFKANTNTMLRRNEVHKTDNKQHTKRPSPLTNAHFATDT